jgi:NADH-quinone oxidoreductase subunit N
VSTLQLIRPENLTFTSEQLQLLAPYFWITGGAILALILSVFRGQKWNVFLVCLAACFGSAYLSFDLLGVEKTTLFNGMLAIDRFSYFFNILFGCCAGLTLMASFRYLDRDGLQIPEYYVLIVLSTLGMMLMTAALDFIVLFIALELMSIVVYVLVGFRRADRKSNEAAIKYFILGSAASAILLYGTALLYGATGSLNIATILKWVTEDPSRMTPLYSFGALFVLIGFLFKVAAVPFHMWMPDVYQGAPTPVTAYMTTALKAAAFATFLRVFISMGFGKDLSQFLQHQIHTILWVVAVLTMLIGNIIALTQNNLKRMLAYSSIAHTGYLLVGLLSGANSDQGYGPVVLYLVSYAVMNLGAFVVLTFLSSQEDGGLELQNIAGLGQKRVGLSFAFSVFILSMAGIPLTAGFTAKYLIFLSAVQAGEVPLVVLGVLCSAISVYYYLRVLVYLWMKPAESLVEKGKAPLWSMAVVSAMVVMTFQIGVLPEPLIAAARRAVLGL